MLRALRILLQGDQDRCLIQARIRYVSSPSYLIQRIAYEQTLQSQSRWHIAFVGLGCPVFLEA